MIDDGNGVSNIVKMSSVITISVIIAATAFFFYTRAESDNDVTTTASADGYILDKNSGAEDNFKNGKLRIDILVLTGGIDDVLNSQKPIEISIYLPHIGSWPNISINLRENSGKTEANYGENIECDGVIAGPENSGDNLYIKVQVPTTTSGMVIWGETIVTDMWPTDDAVEAVDGTISPASFDNESTYDWWDNGEIISILIWTKQGSIPLSGFDGAYLFGTEVDE